MALSRRQLAAALLEYDNDNGNDYNDDARPLSTTLSPRVSHRDSAMFKPFQPRPLGMPPAHPRPASRYLDDQPRPRSSMSAYGRNIAALEENQRMKQDRRNEEDVDVDVSRWGLPSHLLSPETTHPAKSPSTLNRPDLPPLRTVSSSALRPQLVSSPIQERVASIHVNVVDGQQERTSMDCFREAEAALEQAERVRRLSARLSSTGRVDGENERRMSNMIPVDGERVRRMSNPLMVPLPPSPASTLRTFGRPYSRMSAGRGMASTIGLEEDVEEMVEEPDTPNPFALPPPKPELASRFDPKILEAQRDGSDGRRSLERLRTASMMSMRSRKSGEKRMSGWEMDGRPSTSMDRPISTEGLGAASHQESTVSSRPLHVYDDIPSPEEYGRLLMPGRYSSTAYSINRQTLLRPKTLVMPSMLSHIPPAASPRENIPEGYVVGEKPLPPGSRSSFVTGRPGIPLSLSQKTFRSSLMFGGKREEEAYWVGGAEDEGEVGLDAVEQGQAEGPTDRRPGKLYGKSLMDQLEARKAVMRGKQRVFTGDSRPAMMARASMQSLNILSNPDTSASTPPQDKSRPSSLLPPRGRPLLHFDSRGDLHEAAESDNRISKSKSVFGVDQLWEKEMTKLKAIQEREARELAEREAREALEGKTSKKAKKDKGKGKAVGHGEPIAIEGERERSSTRLTEHRGSRCLDISPVKSVANLPPKLSYSPEKRYAPMSIPVLTEGVPRRRAESRLGMDAWDDSDDEDLSRRRDEGKGKAKAVIRDGSDSDSEDDVPLSKVAASSSKKQLLGQERQTRDESSDEEEDVPLSKLAPPKNSSAVPPISLNMTRDFASGSLGLAIPSAATRPISQPSEANDDDDIPLMLRKSPQPVNDVEDDLPLGYKHANALHRQGEAMRQTMYNPNLRQALTPGYTGSMWGMSPCMMSPHTVYGSPFGGYPIPNMAYPSAGMHGQMEMGRSGMVDMGIATGMVPPQPAVASKAIDSWRKEVAVAPVSTSLGSG